MNSKLAKRIQEMFRVSEIITVNEEAITPIYKVRENAEKFSIKEDELKEYLDDLVQKYNEYLLKINPNLYIVKPIEIFGYLL